VIKKFFLVLILILGSCQKIWAADYSINSFDARIVLNQDRSLMITEVINTKFSAYKHGIFRIIPYIYSARGKTINSKLTVLEVNNENGEPINFTVENYNKSKKIKIGSADKTVIGNQSYVIKYKVEGVVQEYNGEPEIYWNVTGDEWEVPISRVSAKVVSNFGEIINTKCFGCETSSNNQAVFNGKMGMTIVVGINSKNNLKKYSQAEILLKIVSDNWGYLAAILPLLLNLFFWYQKGRDKRYLTENIYYQPDDKTVVDTSLLSRPHLPLVYGPIDGLTPGEIGTIIDEKIDTKDIVAEIVELARLKYLKIEKIEKKSGWWDSGDYKLIKQEALGIKPLTKFQEELFENLFGSKQEVKISELKNKFYKHLDGLKELMYEELTKKQLFVEDPTKVKTIWMGLTGLFIGAGMVLVGIFVTITGNLGPAGWTILGLPISIYLATKMPRKTAKGYSLHRQSMGLQHYLGLGKWREEVMEKNLFLEEMLPIAVSLGVVNQLATEMRDLGVEPPEYFSGVNSTSLVSDLSRFNSLAASNMVAAPSQYSGSGSWSGGSGFSGGGGGGFGGGGGGSW